MAVVFDGKSRPAPVIYQPKATGNRLTGLVAGTKVSTAGASANGNPLAPAQGQ